MEKLFLNKEVTIEELTKGVEFEVDNDDEYIDSEDESVFSDEIFKTYKDDAMKNEDTYEPKVFDIPFSVLKEKMEPVTKDGKILKEVLKCGTGLPIPDKAVVFIHYDAYVEGQKESFDSTRLRRKPYKFLFGANNLIPGLEIAIETMKKDEQSRFIISPDYAYGAMGCPPRIPPAAEILYEVEVIKFYDSKNALEYDELSAEDKKTASFAKVADVYHVEHQLANDLFRNKRYTQAISRYRAVVRTLEDVSVANEEEDEKRKGYLLKLYLNLAQCYLNIQTPSSAVIYADLALKIDPNNPKGLYRMGFALHMTDDFERAEYFLNQAKQFKPYEKSINSAMKKLELRRKQHLDWEKQFCRKMFSSEDGDLPKEDMLEETAEFVDVVKRQIEEFVKSDEREFHFSAGYTEQQVEVVKTFARKYDLAFVTKVMGEDKINKLVKKSEVKVS